MSFDKLRILDDRQQAREKLPTFYGSRSNYYHAFREVALNNTIDEIENNYDSGTVAIKLHDDLQTLTIKDTGRGMPIHKETGGVPNWQIFFSILFASGKYDNKQDNSGTNGLGGTVANYTSEFYKVKVWHDAKNYEMSFKDGGILDKPVTFIKDTTEHGTEISFKLDKECYENTTYNPVDMENMIKIIAAVANKTTIYFNYKEETKIIHYNSMEDYFKENYFDLSSKIINFDKKLYLDENEETKIELVFASSREPLNDALLNKNHLVKKGSINDGMLKGFRNFIHKYIQEKGLYEKKEKNITPNDIENSISFLVSINSNNVEYEGQTKFATEKKLYNSICQKYIQENLEVFKVENQKELDVIVNQILITKRANEKAENSRKNIKKILEEKVNNASNRPDKFVPCRSKNPKEVELILIEGDSAMNSVKLARDSKTMCIYPLKGKPINALKNKLDDVLINQEIKDIFKILGCGMSYKGKNIKGIPHFNIDNLQVDKILITVDADVDGGHILAILIGDLYTLAPELLKQGKVYILYTPLYIITCDKKEYFAYTEEERSSLLKSFKKPFTEKRFKGLGGLSVKNMSKAMSIDNRILRQITFEDVEKCIEKIELFLSEEKIAERKEFIETQGSKYFDYSILEG